MRASSNIVCTAWRERSSRRRACAISSSRERAGPAWAAGAGAGAAFATGGSTAANDAHADAGSASASPRAVSIHTSQRRAARIRSRSAGDSSRKERVQKGVSSQERPRRSTYIPSTSSLLVIFFSKATLQTCTLRHLLLHYQYHTPKIMIKTNKLVYMAKSQQIQQ